MLALIVGVELFVLVVLFELLVPGYDFGNIGGEGWLLRTVCLGLVFLVAATVTERSIRRGGARDG